MRHVFHALDDQTKAIPGSAALMVNVPMDEPVWRLLCRLLVTELADGTVLIRVVEEELSL